MVQPRHPNRIVQALLKKPTPNTRADAPTRSRALKFGLGVRSECLDGTQTTQIHSFRTADYASVVLSKQCSRAGCAPALSLSLSEALPPRSGLATLSYWLFALSHVERSAAGHSADRKPYVVIKNEPSQSLNNPRIVYLLSWGDSKMLGSMYSGFRVDGTNPKMSFRRRPI